ncbi:MAG: hypothetical protein QG608_1371 [Actinomycetota bacterium]|nr:hypothetical protein [Actinomycetota bacterium]
MSFCIRMKSVVAATAATVCAGIIATGLAPGAAAVTIAQKEAVLSSWTQTSVTSFNAWKAARANPSAWAEYNLDWSTDYCSASPDNPLGFEFETPCARHDFGYRNYKIMGTFPSNKARIDSAFHEDLLRVCGTYSAALRTACNSLAWTYYQAVKLFGSLTVSKAQVERARALLPEDRAVLRELDLTASQRAGL